MNKEILTRLYDESIGQCSVGSAWEWEEAFAKVVIAEVMNVLHAEGTTLRMIQTVNKHFGLEG